MRLKTVIIDDEKNACDLIEAILQHNFPDIEIVSKIHSPVEAVQEINRIKPDLVFLDIEMPFANAFEVLEAISFKDFEIIFVTAFNQYAIKAFKFSASDYILKPVSEKELIASVKRISAKREIIKRNEEKLKVLLENASSENQKKIALYFNERLEFVHIDDIVRLEADSRYTYVYLKTGSRHLVTKNIGEFESMLCENGFYRVHKSHIINLEFVKSVSRKSISKLILLDGAEVPVSRRKHEDFFRTLKNRSVSR